MRTPLEQVVDLLDLEDIEVNIFRGGYARPRQLNNRDGGAQPLG